MRHLPITCRAMSLQTLMISWRNDVTRPATRPCRSGMRVFGLETLRHWTTHHYAYVNLSYVVCTSTSVNVRQKCAGCFYWCIAWSPLESASYLQFRQWRRRWLRGSVNWSVEPVGICHFTTLTQLWRIILSTREQFMQINADALSWVYAFVSSFEFSFEWYRSLRVFDTESHASIHSDKTKEGLSLFGKALQGIFYQIHQVIML